MRLLPLLIIGLVWEGQVAAQQPDSTRSDSARARQLAPLEVTVTRSPERSDRVPASVGTLSAEELRRGQPTVGLDEVFGRIPGLVVANRYNFSLDQRLSIRGAGSRGNFGLRGVKLLLDGIPQTLPDGQSQLSNIDLGLIDRAEVIVGASSALYGNASGGVLSLSTEMPVAPLGERVRFLAGSFGTTKLSSVSSLSQGRLRAVLGASRFATDGFRQQSAAESRQVTLAADYDLSGSSVLKIRYFLADNPKAQNAGALTAAEVAAQPDSAAANNILRRTDKAVTQNQLGLTFRHLGAKGDFEATAFGLTRDLWNPLATPPPGPPGPTIGTISQIDRLVGGGRVRATRFLGPSATPSRYQVTAGIDAQLMRDDRLNKRGDAGVSTGILSADQRETTSEIGAYGSLHLELGSGILVLAGGRVDRVRFRVQDHYLDDGIDNSGVRTMAAPSGSAGISWARNAAWIPYFNLATAFETPTSTELVNQSNGQVGFNTSLGPQRSVTAELGFRGTVGRLVDGTRFHYSLAAYATGVRDALVQAREQDGRAFFENAARLRYHGIEAGFAADPAPWLSIQAAYTFTDGRFSNYRIPNGATVDTFDGKRPAGIPKHSLRGIVAVGSSRFRVEVEQQLTSDLYGDDRNTLPVAGWGAGVTAIRLTANAVVGGSAERQGVRLAPFVGINNLFDRRYISSVTVNGAAGRVYEPAPGRNLYLGMEVELGGRR